MLDTGCASSGLVDGSIISKIPSNELDAIAAVMQDISETPNYSPVYHVTTKWLFQNQLVSDENIFVANRNAFGLPFLARFNVTFDFPHNRVYFCQR